MCLLSTGWSDGHSHIGGQLCDTPWAIIICILNKNRLTRLSVLHNIYVPLGHINMYSVIGPNRMFHCPTIDGIVWKGCETKIATY
jgi:hypothetical protein